LCFFLFALRRLGRYAGWIGTIAARYKTESGELSSVPGLAASGERLAAVAGTSTCHVIQVCIARLAVMCFDTRCRVPREFLYPAYGVLTRFVQHRGVHASDRIAERGVSGVVDERRGTVEYRSSAHRSMLPTCAHTLLAHRLYAHHAPGIQPSARPGERTGQERTRGVGRAPGSVARRGWGGEFGGTDKGCAFLSGSARPVALFCSRSGPVLMIRHWQATARPWRTRRCAGRSWA
jgi:hypothetical protein